MSAVIELSKLGIAIACLLLSVGLRSPLFASVRSGVFWGVIGVSAILIGIELFRILRNYKRTNILSLLILVVAVAGLTITLSSYFQFRQIKQSVLNADPAQLEALGQHFIVGYRDIDEAKLLVEKYAIAGVFITHSNIKDKTAEEIKQEINSLQQIRLEQGVKPLWIAADQEGGIVSRLSPPLTGLPPLSDVIATASTAEHRRGRVIQYASIHGQELSNLGINLNFAPVVDLNKGIVNPADKFSQIYRRAISQDKQIVTDVALQYCQTLETYGVRCTIKHFPGLGRVANDTHIADAELYASPNELSQDDWVPFQQVVRQSNALIMLGHAKLMAIDPAHPASFSKSIIDGILRKDWQYDGILVTDDFSMKAVSGSKAGVGKGAIAALNSGVDLILISYDKDLYYKAMYALLKANQSKTLDVTMLKNSERRLAKTI